MPSMFIISKDYLDNNHVLLCIMVEIAKIEFAPSHHIYGWHPYNVRTLYGTTVYVLLNWRFAQSNHIHGWQQCNVRTLYGTMVHVL